MLQDMVELASVRERKKVFLLINRAFASSESGRPFRCLVTMR
jgi:hypothetical protein